MNSVLLILAHIEAEYLQLEPNEESDISKVFEIDDILRFRQAITSPVAYVGKVR